MRILINRKVVQGPWGGGNNFVQALTGGLQQRGHHVTNELDGHIDCFFMVDPRPENDCPGLANILQDRSKFKGTKIVHRVNECDARKNTEHMDHLLLHCSQFVDTTIFVSNWMSNYFKEKGWRCSNTSVVHNGCDANVFKPGHRQSGRLRSVVTHHWSNNIMKGFDVYEFLDYMAAKDLIEFTYIGRHRNTFSSTRCIDPCSGIDLAKRLQGHDVYISGSRNDPGPNHVLEAISVGLPTYVHEQGGGAVEFAGKDHTFKNLADLENLILGNSFAQNEYKPISWNESIQKYIRIIER